MKNNNTTLRRSLLRLTGMALVVTLSLLTIFAHSKASSGSGGALASQNLTCDLSSLSKRETGALHNVGGSNTWGGVYIAVGDVNSCTLSDAIRVSSISMPRTAAYSIVIDPRDASRARALFAAQRGGGIFVLTFKGQVAGEHIQTINSLRSAATNGESIPAISVFAGNDGNSQPLAIELQNCLVSSYSKTGHSSSANLGLPMVTFSLNFVKITYQTPPVGE